MGVTTAPIALGVSLGTEEASANTAETLVKRDASGNFSAGTITANLTGAVAGNADTATKWQTARNLSLTGDVTATLTSVDGSAAVSAAATIANDAVTADKLRDDASTDANRAVTTNHIRNNAVTTAKLASDIFVCRAWVNFDATTAPLVDGENRCTINGSGNVTKVVRTATGKFTVTMTTALSTANYAVVGMVEPSADDTRNLAIGLQASTTPTTTVFQILTGEANSNTKANYNPTMVAVFA